MAVDCVLDASVAAKVFFDEPGSEQSRQAVAGAGRLIAPEWITLELASIAVRKVRARSITAEQAQTVMADLPALLDELVPVTELGGLTVEMALSSMTSAYDATYAALARREGISLLTADKRLAAALGAHRDTPPVVLVEFD